MLRRTIDPDARIYHRRQECDRSRSPLSTTDGSTAATSRPRPKRERHAIHLAPREKSSRAEHEISRAAVRETELLQQDDLYLLATLEKSIPCCKALVVPAAGNPNYRQRFSGVEPESRGQQRNNVKLLRRLETKNT